MFSVALHFHTTMAVLSLVFFIMRFVLGLRQQDSLNNGWLRIVPHIVDALFVLSILTMIFTVNITVYPDGWTQEKALFLVSYIVFSVVTVLALRGRVSTMLRIPCFVLALLSWVLAVKVAFMKIPLLLG